MKTFLRTLYLSLICLLFSAVVWLGWSDSGLQWSFQQIQQRIPGQLTVDRMSGNLFGRLNLSGVEYQNEGQTIQLQRMSLDWQVSSLIFGIVEVDELALNQLAIQLPASEAKATNGDDTSIQLPEVNLPLRIKLRQMQLDGLSVIQGENQFDLQRLVVDIATRWSAVSIRQLQLQTPQYSLSVLGKIDLSKQYPHDLQVEWSARLDSGDLLEGKGTLAGDLQNTLIQQNLTQPTQVVVKGELKTILDSLSWQADIAVTGFDHKQWKMELPALNASTRLKASGNLKTVLAKGALQLQQADTGRVSADYKLRWNEKQTLDIQSLAVDFKDADMKVTAQGGWQPGEKGGKADLSLKWRNLHWPLQSRPWFFSEKGEGQVQGSVDDYRFTINTTRPVSEMPESQWAGKGRGDLKHVQFEQLKVEALQGILNATGRVDWSDQVSWQARVSALDLNPAELAAQWPGLLNAEIEHQGGVRDGELYGDAEIKSLQGTLRNYPVKLSSRMSWREQGLDIHQLDFKSASSTLMASGRINNNMSLDWALQSPDLSELLPHSSGALNAKGQLLGSVKSPLVKAVFNGKKLAFETYSVATVEGVVEVDPLQPQTLDVDVEASDIMIKDQLVQSLAINGNASELELNLNAGDYLADLVVKGKTTQNGWKGELVNSVWTLGPLKKWILQKPAELGIESERITLQQACWNGGEQSSICGEFDGTLEQWSSNLQLTALPLNRFERWFPDEFKLDSSVSASVNLKLLNQQILGEASLDFPQGKIQFPLNDEENEQWSYQSAGLKLKLTPQKMDSQAFFNLKDGQNARMQLELPGAITLDKNWRQQKMLGNIQLNLDDLELVGAWIPEVQELKGQANVALDVSGTLSNPGFKGQASLTEGRFLIPRLGLKVRKLNFTGQSQGLDRLEYQLAAESGDGQLTVSGYVQRDEELQWVAEARVTGKQFEVAKIPEAQVMVSPYLLIKAQPHQIFINGNVRIPYAHIEPRDLSTAVRVSNDVVIVGAEQPEQKQWQIHSNVLLVLGDRVHFFGFGFEGRLGGQLLIQEQPGIPTRGNGEIIIEEGRYRAYGQRLDIDKGRIVFSGGPISKPGLDLSAVRTIGTVTVGVNVSGTVDKPQIDLFSSPAMGQTDILSYLLLGRPVESASDEEGAMMAKAALAMGLSGGDRLARSLREQFELDELRVESSEGGDQASLVIGRYLSSRLYVSYGIGLIEAFNTLIIRYQLSKHWQLKAESGEAHSADLLYTIDR